MGEKSFQENALLAYATALLHSGGLVGERASVVAGILLEADMLGHTTHGLALLPGYLAALANGTMQAAGEPEVVVDRGATVLLDGRRLPGPWLVHQAIGLALGRVETHGTVSVVIRRSHHIACLAAYLERVTAAGKMILLMSSDPNAASVAPHGGTRAFITPNPIAAGIPTPGRPILIDVSASTPPTALPDGCMPRVAALNTRGCWMPTAAPPTTRPRCSRTRPAPFCRLAGSRPGTRGSLSAYWSRR